MVAYGNLITALQPSFCSFCVADNLLDTLLNENFIISHSISPLLVSGVQLAYQVHVPTITVSSWLYSEWPNDHINQYILY
jgi:hypothetical protein